jgi:hypothetical protein
MIQRRTVVFVVLFLLTFVTTLYTIISASRTHQAALEQIRLLTGLQPASLTYENVSALNLQGCPGESVSFFYDVNVSRPTTVQVTVSYAIDGDWGRQSTDHLVRNLHYPAPGVYRVDIALIIPELPAGSHIRSVMSVSSGADVSYYQQQLVVPENCF